jgi:hypothetical protein
MYQRAFSFDFENQDITAKGNLYGTGQMCRKKVPDFPKKYLGAEPI